MNVKIEARIGSYFSEYKDLLIGFIFLLIAVSIAWFLRMTWFDITATIRGSVSAGDSGHLIMASAKAITILTLVSTSIFVSLSYITNFCVVRFNISSTVQFIIRFFGFIGIDLWICNWLLLPFEWMTTILTLSHLILVFHDSHKRPLYFSQMAFITLQVFFAYQWLNIVPILSHAYFGSTDVYYSIKLTSDYLGNELVLNFAGFAFFMPVFFAAIVTSFLFKAFEDNMQMAEENHSKEVTLHNIRSQVMDHRIYQEINLLAHDLKTPLVTIKGLSSLLGISNEDRQVKNYAMRIDGAVAKMTEMVSSFLYGDSRQNIHPSELMTYISAQIPMQDDTLRIHIHASESLPMVSVNKVRVVRALINILENAIVAPCLEPVKVITIKVELGDCGIVIKTEDNGIGINAEELSQIWEIGYSTTNTTGLGLPFAKQIIEENRGWIEIYSVEQKGTVVIVFLPSAD